MDVRSSVYGAFLFIISLGLLMQLFGLIDGPINSIIHGHSFTVTNPVTKAPLVTIPFAPSAVKDMLANLITILGIYFGASFFVGLIKGGYSPGFDFQFFAKVILIATLYTVVAPIFQMFSFFYTLGEIGKMIALFLGVVYFLTGFGILYIHST